MSKINIENQLLSEYEKVVGFSSSLFNNEDWAEFNAFCIGYKLAKSDTKFNDSLNIINQSSQPLNPQQ